MRKSMNLRRWFALAAAVVMMSFAVMPVMAAEADKAAEETAAAAAEEKGVWPVDVDKTDCSLELELNDTGRDGKPISVKGGSIAIYTVAGVKVDNGFVYDISVGKFADDADVQDIPSMTSSELDGVNFDLAKKLAGKVDGIEADQTVAVADGKVLFENLKPGLYLVVQAEKMEKDSTIVPFLISIPDENGNYNLKALPKKGLLEPETEPPTEPAPPVIPKTGQVWWPVPVLSFAGILFVVLGIFMRRSSNK